MTPPPADRSQYAITRFLILRLLGLIYFVAFLCLVLQFEPLIGRDGLLPAESFLERVLAVQGSAASAVSALPTLFWIDCSDATLRAAAWGGLVLSAAVLVGATNAPLQFALWALYFSFVQIGQLFYGYGWESQLCETGFLAIFLCPLTGARPFPAREPPVVVLWLFRWLIARIMLGAGLIKLRGDPCWRDFTCLAYHYETQPIPNPISWWLHARPMWFHVLGVAFNHFVELIAPFFLVAGRHMRLAAGVLFVTFQATLIVSGNLSFLNWLTIIPALACFDDRFLAAVLPWHGRNATAGAPARSQAVLAWALALLVGFLSIGPVANLFSPRQAMNRSFEPFRLVNTYGAFGSVGRVRYEVILEGTPDDEIGPRTEWREYQFPCKPGDVNRQPCFISPYHYRADWQIWFAAMSDANHQPWLLRLVAKLLDGDPTVKTLLAVDPFPNAPPRFVRARLFRYDFTAPGEGGDAWWKRTFVRPYLRPLAVDDFADHSRSARTIGKP